MGVPGGVPEPRWTTYKLSRNDHNKMLPEENARIKDPRSAELIGTRLRKSLGKRRPYRELPVYKLRFDKYSLAPPPKTYLLISGFSTLVLVHHVRMALSAYGSVKTCELAINDKMASLGAARVNFDGDLSSAHKIAAMLVQRQLTIHGESVTVEWDESRQKFDALVAEDRRKTERELARVKDRQAREARIKMEKTNERAMGEHHIYIRRQGRPNLNFNEHDLKQFLDIDVLPVMKGFCIFTKSIEHENLLLDRIKEFRYKGIPMKLHAFPRSPINTHDRHLTSSRQVAGSYALSSRAPLSPANPSSAPPSSAPTSLYDSMTSPYPRPHTTPSSISVAAPLANEKAPSRLLSQAVNALADDISTSFQKAILSKFVAPIVIDELKKIRSQNRQHGDLTMFMKRKPEKLREKLNDVQFHFRRKRPKLADAYNRADSEETADSRPIIEDMPMEEVQDEYKQTSVEADHQQIMDSINAETGVDTFASDIPYGITRGPYPQPLFDPPRDGSIYLSDFVNQIVDDDDFEAVKQSFGKTVSVVKPEQLEVWTQIQRELEARHRLCSTSIENVEAKMLTPDWPTAAPSWRSRGYAPVTHADKASYLPKLRQVKNENEISEEALAVIRKLEQDDRESRSSNRRVTRDLSTFETDALSFNELLKHTKKVEFYQSSIHNWGLYAGEPIAANDMIIEYVGQVIRTSLADTRERYYTINGIGSSYLFRVNQEMVIDATKRGNVARLINHSCDPTCIAKVITVGGMKRICIYAARQINTGDELTYDYRFEEEEDEDRIPCLCGASICKGYLN